MDLNSNDEDRFGNEQKEDANNENVTQDKQQELIDLLILLQTLSSTQFRSLCQFVQAASNHDTTFLSLLIPLLQRLLPDQLDKFLLLVSKRMGEDVMEETRKELQEIAVEFQIPPKEIENTMAILFGLWNLQSLLKSLSILQIMKLFEIILLPGDLSLSQESHGNHMQQLQLLQQTQQIFIQLDSQVLQRFHQQIMESQPGTEQQVLMQLLNLPAEYFQLYQPLRLLLQLDIDELLKLKQVFSTIIPIQMLQLLQLLQQQPFDVLELRNILKIEDGSNMNTDDFNSNEDDDFLNEPSISQVPMDSESQSLFDPNQNPNPSSTKKITVQIVEQPPEKSVYKRNLRPNPIVMLVGDQKMNDGNLYVVPTLLRCDTFTDESKYLTGNRPVRVTSGRVLTFRKLKITTTSHQQQETLFCIRFELRKYSGTDEYEILDSIHSNPISVLSHSTQMKPVPTIAPTITDVVPESGSITGGTRIAILGSNFVESPAARIRFDNIDVMPVFHGPGTLICHTPQHSQGTVSVRVCNSAKKWSDTVINFTYVASGDRNQ